MTRSTHPRHASPDDRTDPMPTHPGPKPHGRRPRRIPAELPQAMLDVLHAIPGDTDEWITHADLSTRLGVHPEDPWTRRTLNSLRHRGWILRDQREEPTRYHRTPTGNLAAKRVKVLA